jgi:hypothetical protein
LKKKSSTQIKNNPYPKISYIIFGIVLIVSLISLVPVVFPAFISDAVIPNGFEQMGLTTQDIDPFETGPLAGLLIFSNIVIFGVYFFRKKIPIISKISKIFSFDIPKKISLVIVFVVIVAYGSIVFSEVYTDEIYEDWNQVEKRLNDDDIFTDAITSQPYVRWFLLQQSTLLFGSYKIIPLLSSMALLAMTYLFTTSLTKNNFSGLVSMGLVLQSYIFLNYDTSSTYTSFWILFYLLSLYSVVKFWFANPVFYVASIFSKLLVALFSPMLIFFILNSDISKKHKFIITGILSAMLIVGGSMLSISSEANEEFTWHEFWVGFTSFAFQMRFDVITLVFLVPLTYGLFIVSKNNRYANSISVLIIGILLAAPILTGLTDKTNQPYRLLPLIVFFAVGVGLLFSKTTTKV